MGFVAWAQIGVVFWVVAVLIYLVCVLFFGDQSSAFCGHCFLVAFWACGFPFMGLSEVWVVLVFGFVVRRVAGGGDPFFLEVSYR